MARQKRKNPKSRFDLECPKCGGKNLNFLPWLGMIYECRKCHYRGPLTIKRSRGRPAKI
jgi:C4-type Zn-finger protein